MNKLLTVINPMLDLEYVTSKYLDTYILPLEYCKIRSLFGELRIIQSETMLDEMYYKIISKISTKEELLDDSQMEKFYKGANKSLLDMMVSYYRLLEVAMEDWQTNVERRFEETFNRVDMEMSQKKSFSDKLDVTETLGIYQEYLKDANDIKVALETDLNSTRNLLELYGSGKGKKTPDKIMPAKYGKKYRAYLMELQQEIANISDIGLVSVMYRAVQMLIQIYPKDDFDPFKIDEYNNLLKLLTNPKSYFSMYNKNAIISSGVAQTFSQIFPTFAENAFEEASDKLNKKTPYQKQLTLQKDFLFGHGDPKQLSLMSSPLGV